MKSVTPATPWVEKLTFRVFETRTNDTIPSALPGNDKRIFKFMCGQDRTTASPESAQETSGGVPRATASRRLFCSKFIKVNML